MAWFQRERDPAAAPADLDPGDDRGVLLADLATLRRYLNQCAGKLPTMSLVTAHQIGDLLRAVIDTDCDRPLDTHTIVRVRGFLTDYVLTTVRSFMAVDERVGAVSGRTTAEILQEQLQSLVDEAAALLTSARSYDSDALLTQGTFLRTKFSRSDLDL